MYGRHRRGRIDDEDDGGTVLSKQRLESGNINVLAVRVTPAESKYDPNTRSGRRLRIPRRNRESMDRSRSEEKLGDTSESRGGRRYVSGRKWFLKTVAAAA